MLEMGDKSEDELDVEDLCEKIKKLEREKELLERKNMKKKHAELTRSIGQLRKQSEPEPHPSSLSPSIDKNYPSRGRNLVPFLLKIKAQWWARSQGC